MNLSQVLLTALKENGAREVFGLPGDFALAFFKIAEDSAILPFYMLSHEPSLGFAADAAARMNLGLGVAAVTYGVGAFNLVNSIAGAYAEKSPVVVISGAPGTREAERGLLLHHQAKTLDSQFRVFTEITCAQTRLDDPAAAPAEIARVLRAALDRSRPVYIELPRDLVGAPCEPVGELAAAAVDDEAVAACAEEILDRLARAKAPILMAGVEVRRYDLEDRVAKLARVLGLPVVTSFMGRGLLAHKDVPFIGTYLGLAGEPEVTRAVEESDGLLLLGVILCDTNFGLSSRHIDVRHTIHVADREARLGHHTYAGIPLAALIDALLERAKPAKLKRQRVEPSYPTGLVEDDKPVVPMDLARAVNDMFEAHGVMPIASDVGDCLFTAVSIRPTDLVAPGYYAGMGFGVPAGLGLQATSGRRPLILVGDGAFQMTGWELGNCRRYGWNPVVIVFNNASWEMLRVFEPEAAYNDLPKWDFAALADAMGGVGRRVTNRRELKAALEAALADESTFQLIDVELARGEISETLARFVAGVRRSQAPQSAATDPRAHGRT